MIQFKTEHVTVFESSIYNTTSTVIHTKDMILIVDPALLPIEVEEIRNYVHSIKKDKPIYLFFTHSDYDHILGYNAFPDAISIGSIEMDQRDDKDQQVDNVKNFDSQFYFQRDYEIEYPELNLIIEKDGQELKVGNTTITFYKAPGHTNDGVFAIVESLGIFITGDHLCDVEFPFIYDQCTAYEQTLSKAKEIINKHRITCLIPGHGNTTTNKHEMNNRIEESSKYLQETKKAVLENREEESYDLVKHYPLYRTMKSQHENNLNQIKNELEKEKIQIKA
ncbi:MBL fold metallo-hydrolase [Chengkuizengella axinellae]|uniref:MBL fold metallo-hydrolase n=1 Tax=Chengkuizengella axinellae TaxID=3064388 RepID=A0ABT9J2N6_9BACL|nr:MBL fold metallo-hydrolase [Chengkuizengella sp. 2205SS18-9]MDP5275858.1 MBL fold metallo-hydrolase [Chengkuizengella sp. 2205SS18-9]